MPVLYIRSTNVSSCAFVAYACFRPMLNPERLSERLWHRHRRRLPLQFRTLAGQPGQLRKNGAVAWNVGAACGMLGSLPNVPTLEKIDINVPFASHTRH